MSRYSGPQHRGAARDAKKLRRFEAEDRQATFDAKVAKVAYEQNCEPETARDVVRGRRRFEHRLAARRTAAEAQGAGQVAA